MAGDVLKIVEYRDLNTDQPIAQHIDGEHCVAVEESPVFTEDGQDIQHVIIYVDASEDILTKHESMKANFLRRIYERFVPAHLKRKAEQIIAKAEKVIAAVGDAISDLGDSVADNVCNGGLETTKKVKPNLDSCVDVTADNFIASLEDSITPLGSQEEPIGLDSMGAVPAAVSPFSALGHYHGFGGMDPVVVAKTSVKIPISNGPGNSSVEVEFSFDEIYYHNIGSSPFDFIGSDTPGVDVGTAVYITISFGGSQDIESGPYRVTYDVAPVDPMMGAFGAFGQLPPESNPLEALGLSGSDIPGVGVPLSHQFGRAYGGFMDFSNPYGSPSTHEPTQIFSGEKQIPAGMLFGLQVQDETADPSKAAGLIAPYGAPVPSGIISEGRDAAGSVEGYSARDDVRHTTVEASSSSGKGGDGEKKHDEEPKQETQE